MENKESADEREGASPIPQAIWDRVERGRALLDERVGRDWPWRIELDRLDVWSGLGCVLAQLFNNSFDDGQRRLFEPEAAAAQARGETACSCCWPGRGDLVRAAGFLWADRAELAEDEEPPFEGREVELLEAAWRDLIERLRPERPQVGAEVETSSQP